MDVCLPSDRDKERGLVALCDRKENKNTHHISHLMRRAISSSPTTKIILQGSDDEGEEEQHDTRHTISEECQPEVDEFFEGGWNAMEEKKFVPLRVCPLCANVLVLVCICDECNRFFIHTRAHAQYNYGLPTPNRRWTAIQSNTADRLAMLVETPNFLPFEKKWTVWDWIAELTPNWKFVLWAMLFLTLFIIFSDELIPEEWR